MIAELLIGAPLAGALSYAVGYSAWAQARWPRVGRDVRVSGANVHVVEGGDPHSPRATPILFLHGASSNAREWLISVAPHVNDRRWIAMDRPGLGWSPPHADAHHLARQAAIAAGVLDHAGIQKAVIVAHSLGAASALRLALDFPAKVAGLVLIAPASHPYPGDNAWHVRIGANPILGPAFAWTLAPIFGPRAAKAGVRATFAPAKAPKGYAQETGLGLLFRPWTFAANARQVRATNSEFDAQVLRYPSITIPTVIITADQDQVVSPKIHAFALARDISGAELISLPGAGHMPHQLHPDMVGAAVTKVAALTDGA